MNSDKIDLATLPALDVPTGMFGSVVDGAVYNDKVVAIMVYIYDSSAVEAFM